MKNIYKIEYYYYDAEDNMYYDGFYNNVSSDKTEEEMRDMIDEWNKKLKETGRSGTFIVVPLNIYPLEEITYEYMVEGIMDL